MKQKIILLLFALPLALQAQQNTVTAGGDASGVGGSASYSVGQIAWHAIPSQDYSVQEGLQQPFEVFVLSAPEHQQNYAGITVYPNPVANGLTLQFDDLPEESDYELYNISGQLIQTEHINVASTPVSMESFPTGIYILQVMKDKKSIKSFKIVKN